MSNTIYINSIKAKRSKYGVKLTGKAEDIIKDIQANTNSKGYINWELKERRTAGKYGETHSVTVDTWQPTKGAQAAKDSDLPF